MSESGYSTKLAPAVVVDLSIFIRTEGTGAERLAEAKSAVDAVEAALQNSGASISVREVRFS